jgi:hypothetical protein
MEKENHMALHEAHNSETTKSWCGPTVVSSITGRDVARVKDLIRDRRGYKWLGKEAVKGTTWNDIHHALKHYGYRLDSQSAFFDKERPTLAGWLRMTSKTRKPDAYYVVNLTDHWVVIHGRKFCDSLTKGKPVFLRSAPGRRKRVERVYVVVR